MKKQENAWNGIVNIYKPAGFTSFDVVAKCRGIFGQRKIGHTGTLDPDAVGVLPVCFGNATKVIELLTDYDKEYVAELALGFATDTQDISGAILQYDAQKTDRANQLTREAIQSAILSFRGDYDQIPPMYSALKVNGQKLYDLARKGIEVERKARRVHIFELEILEICAGKKIIINLPSHKGEQVEVTAPVIRMRILCSKGTYIRTLCDDIGKKLGVDGTMVSLMRTKVGPFVADKAYSLEELQRRKDENTLDEVMCSVDSLFMDFDKLTVTEEGLKGLSNGNKLPQHMVQEHVQVAGKYRVYRPDGSFAAIYQLEENSSILVPVKMFL